MHALFFSSCVNLLSSSLLWIVMGSGQLTLICLLIAWITTHQRRASRGNESSAKRLLFPIHNKILLVLLLAQVVESVVEISAGVHRELRRHKDKKNEVTADTWVQIGFAFTWASYHFASEGLGLLLIQPGCGRKAFAVSLRYAAVWALFVCFALWISLSSSITDWLALSARVTWDGIMFLFYFVIAVLPEKRWSRRPSALFYARFWAASAFCGVSAALLIKFDLPLSCEIFLVSELVFYCLCRSWIAYYALLLDARWWQGLAMIGDSVHNSNQSNHSNHSNPSPRLLRLNRSHHQHKDSGANSHTNKQQQQQQQQQQQHSPFTRITRSTTTSSLVTPLIAPAACELAEQMDSLKSKKSLLLNSAFLSVNYNGLLGAGRGSKVYLGRWKNVPCAVKMLHSWDLTSQDVVRYMSETKLLSRVTHPNVVQFFGICVVPPSLCLVLELCSHGNLFNFLHSKPTQDHSTSNTTLSRSLRSKSRGSEGSIALMRAPSCSVTSLSFAKVNLTWEQRLHFAVDAAKGVAALHAMHISHNDVKSLNFLVQWDPQSMRYVVKIGDLDVGGDTNEWLASAGQETVGTLNWMAPERLLNKMLNPMKADIYSLGVVLFEIFCLCVPFEGLRPLVVREKIAAYEPPLVPELADPEVCRLCGGDGFRALLHDMWDANPEARPSAERVVERLEVLLQRCQDWS